MSVRTLEVNAGRLVLQGLDRPAGERVTAALQGELERLARDGVPGVAAGSGPPSLAVRVEAGASPERIGVQLARALWGRLGRGA